MSPAEILKYFRGLGVGFSVTPEGMLHVEAPADTLTDEGIELLRVHRDALIAALSAPLDWPSPEPEWFARWMREDDARRIATLAAALRRKGSYRKSA